MGSKELGLSSFVRDRAKNEDETVLVLGGSGLVGSYLLPQLVDRYTSVYVSSHTAKPRLGKEIKLDLSSPELTTRTLESVSPSIIVNLAAFTEVDGCEKNQDYAVRLNSQLPEVICDFIALNRRRGNHIYLLHISTDYVFDGEEGNYVEESQPNPLNWYGKTKFFGEQSITTRLDCSQWGIARTSTPFGIHSVKQTFPIFIINETRKGKPVKLVTDQYTSPTYSLDLARMLSEIIERRINGIIHTAGISGLSRYEQGMRVAELFNLNTRLILKSSSTAMNWLAPRPRKSTLNVEKATKLLKYKPRSYDESIKDFYCEFHRQKGGNNHATNYES